MKPYFRPFLLTLAIGAAGGLSHPAGALASGDTYLCRCYAEPKHLFAGDIRVTAKHPADAAQKAKLKCKAQAWGLFGQNNWSMDTCFKN